MAFEQLTLFGRTAPPATPTTPATRQRHIHLADQIVPYLLRQGQRRRRLSLTVDERGLIVGAPARLPLHEIEAFIRKNNDWVLEKLATHVGQRVRRQPIVHDGLRLPLLGDEITLRMTTGNNAAHWHEKTLLLALREAADPATLLRRALQRRALEIFAQRMQHYATLLKLKEPRLGLSSARTRWGSCSLRSGIRINWRLIHLPLALIDYVIAHELAHLLEMNHSPRFWEVVERIYPDWQKARLELKRLGREIPLF